MNKKSGFVYFLHIPKTSGASLTQEINRENKNLRWLVDGRYIFPASKEPKNSFTPKSIICGHFALNPFDSIEFDYAFSIIREPVSRLISLYSYHHRFSPMNLSNKELFMEFVFGTHPKIDASEFAGFDGQPNSQSSYLSTKVYLDECGLKRLPESPSIKKVFESIDNNNIDVFTLDNRCALIAKLGNILESNITDIRSNTSPQVGFELSKSEILEILKINSIDHELYKTVRERELCSK